MPSSFWLPEMPLGQVFIFVDQFQLALNFVAFVSGTDSLLVVVEQFAHRTIFRYVNRINSKFVAGGFVLV